MRESDVNFLLDAAMQLVEPLLIALAGRVTMFILLGAALAVCASLQFA